MEKKKESTLRCVATLSIIAVTCALLLSVLHPLLYVQPTADEFVGRYAVTDGYEWKIERPEQGYDLDGVEGGKVTLAARGVSDGKPDYVGILVETEKSGKLNNSTYVMFVNAETHVLEYAEYVIVGSTGGFTWEKARSNAVGGEVTTGATALTGLLSDGQTDSEAVWREWESFYVPLNDAGVFDDLGVPARTGATFTVTATYNAFRIAACYYYKNYVEGGEAQ